MLAAAAAAAAARVSSKCVCVHFGTSVCHLHTGLPVCLSSLPLDSFCVAGKQISSLSFCPFGFFFLWSAGIFFFLVVVARIASIAD